MALKKEAQSKRAWVVPQVRTLEEEVTTSAPLLMCTAPKVSCPGVPGSCVPDACFCDDSC